ncbi:MAG TPA: peptidoglycan DD-metalloendopeptidase family protein [Alphaproteobacteria bacterium]
MKKSVAIIGLLTGLLVQGCTSSAPPNNAPVRIMGGTAPVMQQNNQQLYPARQAVTQPVMQQNTIRNNNSRFQVGQAQIVSVSPYEGRQIQKQQPPVINSAAQPTYRSTSIYASKPAPVPVQTPVKQQPRGMFDLPPQSQQAATKPAAMPALAPVAVASNAPVVPKTTNMSITDVLDRTIRNAPDETMTPARAIETARTAMPATPLESSGPGQAVSSIPARPVTAGQGHQPSKQAIASLGREKPRFYWPVRGNVISNFGSKGSGKQNDGINITAPKGTAVKAAAAGLVVYSGQDLGGLGNLILIRHSGGYHTAYAHVDNRLVKTGDKVSIGEAIANIGKTGNVTTPQLHFEIRDGKKPVNPDSFLPRA